MKIRYVHHRPREVVPVGQKPFTAVPGETYDLVAKVANSLLEQDAIWQPAAKPSETSTISEDAAPRNQETEE